MGEKFDAVVTSATSWATDRTPQPKKPSYWPLWIIGSGCFVAIWGGWVGLGSLTGFGPVELLPGIWSSFKPNTAITLPLSMEVYGSYALRWWIDKRTPKAARTYAMWSAIASLALGLAGQAGYHLMDAHHFTPATTPWPVTVAVAWVPVIAFGLGAGLRAMLNVDDEVPGQTSQEQPAVPAAQAAPEPEPAAPAAPAGATAAEPEVPDHEYVIPFVHVHEAPAEPPWGLAVSGPPADVPETPGPEQLQEVQGPAPAGTIVLRDLPLTEPAGVRVVGPASAWPKPARQQPAARPRPKAVPALAGGKPPLPSGAELAALLGDPDISANQIAKDFDVTRYTANQMKKQFAAGELAIEEEASENAA
jgi:hypothetical protein